MSNKEILTDKSDEILAATALRESHAFHLLVKRYEKKIPAYIKRSTGASDEQAEDIAQEIFIKVYRHLNGFDTSLKFSSWLYRIARNEIVTFYRKNRRHTASVSIDDIAFFSGLPEAFNENNDLQSSILSDEKNLKIQELLFSLPDKYRDIIVLRFFEEKDYNEISDILKIPVGTVGTLINRAKTRLKKTIKSKYSWLTKEY